MKTKLLVLLFLASLTTYAQYTTIPDVNFEKKLIALGIDSGATDGQVLTSSISSLTSLDVSSSSITDLTGIQDFVALTSFNCYNNQLTNINVSKNVALTRLNCRANLLSTLDITKNIKLQTLDIALYPYGTSGDGSYGKFTSIDLSQNTALTSFICDNNPITLDLSKNVALTNLSCIATSLTSLDLSKNVNLKSLNCEINSISNLDITNNIGLTNLNCRENLLSAIDVTKNRALESLDISFYSSYTGGSEMGKITSIDLSQNTALTKFSCDNNPITKLDLTKNVNLSYLSCKLNSLTSLNLKNGKNTLITSSNLNITSNPGLICIIVDDVSYSNTNWANNKNEFAFYSPYDCSIITKIEDAKFEDKLISLGIDTDGKNGVVLNTSIATITTLDVSNSDIIDLKGIEGFTALTTLNCSGNLFTKIDLSKNASITTLNCSNSPSLICIQVADVTATSNWAITKDATASLSLDCTIYTLIPDSKFEDKLIALGIDRDGKNGKIATESIASLTSLNVSFSSITNLTGIQDFVALKTLDCSHNNLKSLDVTNNTALTNLYPSSNQLTTLDVSQNLALVSLQCWNNQITSLDVSKNIALTSLGCSSNRLSILDVSKNVALSNFNCNDNKLTSLNLKNGTNTLLTTNNISFKSNPDLRCIAVDDSTYSNTNWTNSKDSTAFFTTYDCSTISPIPDSKFEDKLIALGIDTDGKNGFVLNSNIAAITSLDVSNSAITNMKGIEGFTALTTLNCSGNLFTKIDLSKNAAIITLNCSNSPSLICIQVADVVAASNWAITKDATASLSLDCTIYTLIPDSNFEDKLIALGIDKDGKNGKVATESIASLTSLDVAASSITDLTGIQGFTALTSLYCYSNQLTTLDVSKNVALTSLYCGSNPLTTLDVSKNVALTYLSCNTNQLTSLDVSQNVALTFLSCYTNQLTTLDVSKNVALTRLDCESNSLTTLDVSKNVALIELYCYSNKFAILDVSNNIALRYLYCNSNNIATLDVSTNVSLNYLKCSNNQITSLDVSKNVALTNLYCNSNKLISLNLKNGKNTLLMSDKISFTSNPDLKCIIVDDAAYSNTNWSSKKDATAFYSPYDCSLVTQIPDANFEDKLIALGIDTDGKNGVVLNTSIAALTSLDVSNAAITNLKGIEGFTALTTLNCSGNLFTKIDLSKNASIITLNCSNSPSLICIQVTDVTTASNWAITKDATASLSLDCTIYTLIPDTIFEDKLIALGIDKDGKNGKVATESIASLTSLDVSSSSISDLTGIQDFKALTYLRCNNNKFTTLDVSKNVALTSLYCYSNQLTILDVSKNTALKSLDCEFNQLTTLDVSKNLSLDYILCTNNQLTAFDVSNNVKLYQVWCNDNKIKTLDFSKNPLLTQVLCHNNSLLSFNIKNGKNTIINTNQNGGVSFYGNPDLKCILVDDAVYANTNWGTKKDATATFNTDCTPYTLIPDSNFEDKLIALGIDTDGKNGKVKTESIATLTSLEVNNSNIASMSGIEDFVSLNYLDCSGNVLTTLNVTKNVALTYLDCSANTITALDVSSNTALTDLYCNTNQLASLDVSKNLVLNKLNASENALTTLDVSKNTSLTEINCYSNSLTSLNLKNGNNVNMEKMNFSNLAQNPNLICIQVDNAVFCNSNWEAKDATAGYSSDCTALLNTYTTIPDAKFEDKLIALGIDKDGKNGKVLTSSIFNVGTLDVSNSEITDLTGIQDFEALTSLTCSNNALTTLDVSKNLSLEKLYCSVNKIESLDLTKNTALTILSSSFNLLKSLDVSANKSLKQLECSNNNLTYLNIQNGNNINMQSMMFGNFTVNPSLTCILVDDESYSTTNWELAKDKISTYSTTPCAAYTLIPDSNFEDKLIALGIDTDGKNGKVKTESISSQIDLDVRGSSIADMTGIQDFTALKRLTCSENLLTSLDISNNSALIEIFCEKNQLTNLDFSKNSNLKYLTCHTNQLTRLDLSNNLALTYLSCGGNQITDLDVSKNTNLTSLYCSDGKLTKLNIKNGNNTNITAFIATNNPNLSCIQVDDVSYADSFAAPFYKDATATFNTDCAPYTLIPDANFEKFLINEGIDSGVADGRVLTSAISSLKTINMSGLNINDLTGIEDFVALTSLNCSYNNLTSLNVSSNIALTNLNCFTNKLTSLNVANNTALTSLNCAINEITDLNLTSNLSLTTLNCYDNKLTSLNVSNNTALTEINCSANPFANGINVTNNKALTFLNCNFSTLTTLDVSSNNLLESLNCQGNSMKSLDISANTALTFLDCSSNQLTSLNLKNGNNANFSTFSTFKFNSGLTCIQVDNATFSTSNWASIKDAAASYNTSCVVQQYTLIPDANFENKLIALGIDADGKNGKVLTSSIFNVGTLDVSNSEITDLTGIQDFVALTSLTCSNNALTTLDVSKNLSLEKLYCSVNKIESLDFTKNTALTILSSSFNLLTSLDVSANKSLKQLECSNNNLTYLNVQNGNNTNMQSMMFGNFTANPNLTCILVDDESYSTANWELAKDKTSTYSTTPCAAYTLIPDTNFEQKLIDLGIDTDGKNGKVKTESISSQIDLDVRGSSITDMTGIQDFTALKRLNCSDNLLTSLDISNNSALIEIFCEKNQLTNLDFSKNSNLDYLTCHTNQLTSLDLSNNLVLTYLSCGLNQFTNLDVSKNTKLTSLYCSDGKLTKLNIKNGNNTNITAFIATNNPNLSCIQVDDTIYADSFAAPFYKDNTATFSTTCSALGIEDSVFDKVAIFPNPTKGELHIDNIVLEKATVYDALGKLVKVTTFASGTKDNTINLEGLPSGIYYIYLESEGANTAKKIILE